MVPHSRQHLPWMRHDPVFPQQLPRGGWGETWTSSPNLLVETDDTVTDTITVTSTGACGPVLVMARMRVDGSGITADLTLSKGGVTVPIVNGDGFNIPEDMLYNGVPKYYFDWLTLDRSGIWTLEIDNTGGVHPAPYYDQTLLNWGLIFFGAGMGMGAGGGGGGGGGGGTTGNNPFQPLITGYTGGGVTKIDGITTLAIDSPQIYTVMISNVLQDWVQVAGTDAAANNSDGDPIIIRPTDYDGATNAKVFKRYR